ncbi:MAG: hypothetical protein AUH81_03305 [Candidatus Rokubacteria bacterium 13_1_40CM_4_69_5]|nr:MAG: hypothetical protein AUH81_03305 [Candidatus Rokubacteria bacterium 13_1_40CM_4_69_5]
MKNPDKATVKLLNALLTSETLTVEIRLFRPDVTGVDVLFHTIQLQNAVISDFNLSGNPNGTVPLNEVVSFTYQTISFTDLNGNVSILSISP